MLLAGGDDEQPERAAPPPAAPPTTTAAPPAGPAAPDRGLAVGIGERNASLLRTRAAGAGGALEPWRDRLERLRPDVYRLTVDWAQLQPSPDRPAELAKAEDGCLRGIAPCGAYAGIRDQLRAVRGQQRAHGGWEVVVTFYGVPDWAAAPARGCERDDIGPRSRPITAAGLRGYRRLVGDVLALARAEGVALRWWSPWNEPNGLFFVSPQRLACDTGAPSVAPAVYARLARAMRAELRAAGGDRRLVLGELAGVDGPSPRATGIGEFVRALPGDVACAGDVWAQHEYVEPGAGAGAVGELQRALRDRPCTRGAPIWVTETGVGGARAGEARDVRPSALRRGCRLLDARLRRWHRDPQVDVAVQYTYREDTEFPVGLVDAALTRTYPTYDLWAAWSARRPGDPPPSRTACSG